MPIDPESRRWLKKLEAACEQVLAQTLVGPTAEGDATARADVEELLARVRAELNG